MSRESRREIFVRFAYEWQRTAISPENWCNREGYAWKSAKRYITVKAAREYLETGGLARDQKTANSQKTSAKKSRIRMKKSRKKYAKKYAKVSTQVSSRKFSSGSGNLPTGRYCS